jgi:hypothetical protein
MPEPKPLYLRDDLQTPYIPPVPKPWTMPIIITYRLNRVHRYNLNLPLWDLTVEFDSMIDLIGWLTKILDAQKGTEEQPTNETGHP